MGLDLKYLKGAFGPKFSDQKEAESIPFRLAPPRVVHRTQSRSHLQESMVAAASSWSPQHSSLLGGKGRINTLLANTWKKKSLCTVTTPGPPRDASTSQGCAADFMDGMRVSFLLWEPFLCNPHACRRNPALGMHRLLEKATDGADAAGFTPEIAQTNLPLAHRKTASCSMQYNTLRY